MKLINASKLSLLITALLFFFSCTYKPESDLVKGIWKYESVEKAGKKSMEIGDNDFMRLNDDSSFEYHIESLNKHMTGHWSYKDHVLDLKYSVPDTLRHFKVLILSNYQLQMQEADVNFKFSRIKP